MIPLEIELHNFLAYKVPEPLRLDGVHVACLTGPNGAGKSSLLDAITWSLWGKARSNSADELIHQGESEMAVSLTFAQGEQRYRVLRKRSSGGRGSSLLELQVWDQGDECWRSLSQGTIRETQAKIDELLRLDYETFVNSAFLVQGQADEFTTKTPSQRKQVLASILGLSRWEAYEDRAKEKIRSVRSQLDQLDARLTELEAELAEREEYERELQQAQGEAEKQAEKLGAAEEKWADLEQSRSDLVSLQRQIDDLTRRIVARRREIEEAEEELEVLRARADEKAIAAALGKVRQELRSYEPVEIERKQALEQRSQLAEEAASLRGANQALVPEAEPLKARAATLESASEPVCPACGQPLTEEHRAELLEDLREELKSRRELYRRNRERVQQIEARLSKVDANIEALDGQLNRRPALEKRAGELEAALEHAGEAAQRARALAERIDRWRTELADEEKKRAALEEKAEETERELQAASLTQADMDRLRREKRMADERVGGARQRLGALENVERQLDDRRRERGVLVEDVSLLEELREAFSKRGVPAMIIETVVPELERAANELLTRMTEGRLHVRIETQREIKSGEVREALDIVIADELGSRPYELYSGGETFRINFAIRIALSRLLANRAGAQLRSLFIDEGFGTQDAKGRDELVEAINSVQDDFDRILVITHIEELKDAFPTRIEVRKTPDGSQFSLN